MKRSSSEFASEGESEVDQKPDLDMIEHKVKKGKPTPSTPKKEKGEKSPKTRWSAEEDATLIGLIESCIADSLWDKVKAEGSLVHRTGYGCKYHALMLLRQGTGGTPTKKK